jgi:hypothetical protein
VRRSGLTYDGRCVGTVFEVIYDVRRDVGYVGCVVMLSGVVYDMKHAGVTSGASI